MRKKKGLEKLVEIIIPTHNRTDSLTRVLDYYSKTGREFHLIIADSSSSKNKALNKKLLSSYPGLKILYIDTFSEKLQQHIKFSKMVKYVKTKYCVFCPDDDFIVPDGIKEAVDFLEKNPDFAAAHGTYIGFHLFKGPFGYKDFWWNFRYKNQSLLEETSAKRLTSYLKNLNLVMWSVRRSNILKSSYEELSRANFDPYLILMYGELLPDSLTVTSGKIKRLISFYAARQYFSSIATNYFTINDALNTKIHDREYKKFRSILVKSLVKMDAITKDKAVKIIDSAMNQYLKYSYQEYLINRINRFLRRIPFLQKLFRFLHASYLLSREKESKLGPIDNSTSKYFNDFEVIRRLVLKSGA